MIYLQILRWLKKYVWIILIPVAYIILDVMGVIPNKLSLFRAKTGFEMRVLKTPTAIQEINEIAELTTAEFYGEVYADLLEVYTDTIQKYGQVTEDYPEIIWKKMPALKSYITYTNQSQFDRNLVYIGRGWVKVGFDFNNPDNLNLEIVEAGDSVTLLVNKPIVLAADINPWYIENQVPGFEVFIEEQGNYRIKAAFTDDEITAVKAKCKQKLLKVADENKIFEKAAETGTETLEQLFGILGYQNVKVRIRQ